MIKPPNALSLRAILPGRLLNRSSYRHQRGSALFLAMLILVVLTLLAVVTSNTSVLQERMAGNFRDSALAFQSAENALRWAESWIVSRPLVNDPVLLPCNSITTCNSTVVQNGLVIPQYEDGLATDWAPVPFIYGEQPTAPGTVLREQPSVAEQPKYIAEFNYFFPDSLTQQPPTGTVFYKITARGVGARPSSVVVLRSIQTRRVD